MRLRRQSRVRTGARASYHLVLPQIMKTITAFALIAASCVSAFAQKALKPEAPLPPGLYATFNTSEGVIVATLYEKYTPESVKSFVGLAQGTKAWLDPQTNTMVKRPMYDNLLLPRSVREDDPVGQSHRNPCPQLRLHDQRRVPAR